MLILLIEKASVKSIYIFMKKGLFESYKNCPSYGIIYCFYSQPNISHNFFWTSILCLKVIRNSLDFFYVNYLHKSLARAMGTPHHLQFVSHFVLASFRLATLLLAISVNLGVKLWVRAD